LNCKIYNYPLFLAYQESFIQVSTVVPFWFWITKASMTLMEKGWEKMKTS